MQTSGLRTSVGHLRVMMWGFPCNKATTSSPGWKGCQLLPDVFSVHSLKHLSWSPACDLVPSPLF